MMEEKYKGSSNIGKWLTMGFKTVLLLLKLQPSPRHRYLANVIPFATIHHNMKALVKEKPVIVRYHVIFF